MKSNIVLIGFMATGKSAVGRLAAERLNRRFVETDALIEQKSGRMIPQIFAADGEAGFRKIEIVVVEEVSRGRGQVIACGGGVVVNNINIERLKADGIIIYLTAKPEVIINRVKADSARRPLLEVADPAEKARQLLAARRPLYESAADITIDTSDLSVSEVAETIILRLEKYAGQNQ